MQDSCVPKDGGSGGRPAGQTQSATLAVAPLAGVNAGAFFWDYYRAVVVGLGAEHMRDAPVFNISVEEYGKALKMELNAAGLMVGSKVGTHSLRRGGCTDMYLAGVDPTTIMKLGRWTPLCWLLYVKASSTDQCERLNRLLKASAESRGTT